MDDLVERLDAEIKRQRETRGTYLDYGTPDPLLVAALARIQALETSLAEAEGRVKALTIALHDAIRRPMGVVPESAEPFYQPALASDEVKT